VSNNSGKPVTQQRDLAKLPRALAPLIERPQWGVWRWTQKPDGSWQKPPFMATRHLGATVSGAGTQHLCRDNAERHWLPDLGPGQW